MKIQKIGGSCIVGNEALVAQRLQAELQADNKSIVVVHGFGPTLRQFLTQAGIERETFTTPSGMQSHFTDETVLAFSHAAAALVQRRLKQAIEALGISVAASLAHKPLVYGKRKQIRSFEGGVVRSFPNDFSGLPISFELNEIQNELNQNQIFLIAPLLHRTNCTMLSGDSDALATSLAVACNTSELVFLTDVNGFIDNGKTVPEILTSDIARHIEIATGGMRKKLIYARKCVDSGVARVVIRNLLSATSSHKETLIHDGQNSPNKQSLH